MSNINDPHLTTTPNHHDPLLRWFRYDHLPHSLQNASKPYYDLARSICDSFPPSAERTVALRKLLESKDSAVRCKVEEVMQNNEGSQKVNR